MSEDSNPTDPSAGVSNPTRTSETPVDTPDDGRAEAATADVANAPTKRPASERRQRLTLVLVSAVLAGGLFLVFRGIMAGVTGDDRARYPAAVEEVSPVPDAEQAFSGETIVVDLASGYVGEITIDDIPIETVAIGDYTDPNPQPGDQIDLPPVTIYEPGNATLTFTPSASAPIEQFSVGSHVVRVEYWKLVDGRQRTRFYTWTFNVV